MRIPDVLSARPHQHLHDLGTAIAPLHPRNAAQNFLDEHPLRLIRLTKRLAVVLCVKTPIAGTAIGFVPGLSEIAQNMVPPAISGVHVAYHMPHFLQVVLLAPLQSAVVDLQLRHGQGSRRQPDRRIGHCIIAILGDALHIARFFEQLHRGIKHHHTAAMAAIGHEMLPRYLGMAAAQGHDLRVDLFNIRALGIILLKKKFLDFDILKTEQHHALSRLAIAPGPACFLIISFQSAGQVKMNHTAHIRLIHPHAKGIGGHNDAVGLRHKGFLRLPTHRIGKPGVIDQNLGAPRAERRRDFLHRTPGGGIDNDTALVLRHQQRLEQLQLGRHGVLRLHPIGQIGAIKSGDKPLHVVATELLHDIGLHIDRGRGCQGQHLRLPQMRNRLAQPQIVGAKIMSPLRDTMRLIHRKQRYLHLLHSTEKAGIAKALRRHIEQFVSSCPARPQPLELLRCR